MFINKLLFLLIISSFSFGIFNVCSLYPYGGLPIPGILLLSQWPFIRLDIFIVQVLSFFRFLSIFLDSFICQRPIQFITNDRLLIFEVGRSLPPFLRDSWDLSLASLAIGGKANLAIVTTGLAATLSHAICLHVPLLILWDVTRISKDRTDYGETQQSG
jgi:hypothetical protein